MVTFSEQNSTLAAALAEFYRQKNELEAIKNNTIATLTPVLEDYQKMTKVAEKEHAENTARLNALDIDRPNSEWGEKCLQYKNTLSNIAKYPERAMINQAHLNKLNQEISEDCLSESLPDIVSRKLLENLRIVTIIFSMINTNRISVIKGKMETEQTIEHALDQYHRQVEEIDQNINAMTANDRPAPDVTVYERNINGDFVKRSNN